MKVAFRKTLSTGGSTRATAYAMSNKIVTTGGKIFVAWLDHVSDIRIRTYDIARECWSGPVLLGTGTDNHSGPAITMDSEGCLHALFGPHVGPFQYRRSQRPMDAGAWTPVEHVATDSTYPGLVCGPDDVLHLFYRGGPPPRRLHYRRRETTGRWTDAVELVNPDVPDGYTQYGGPVAVAPDGTLHLAFHIYDMHPPAGKAAGYLRSRDGGHTWESAAGEPLTLPVTPNSPCLIEQDPAFDLRVGNLALDSDARPWLPVSHLKRTPRSVTLWHHDDTAWRAHELLPAVAAEFPGRALLGGTLTFDAEDVMYVALTTIRAGVVGKRAGMAAIPANNWFGHPSCEIVLATSDDFGETFEVIPISVPDPDVTNWLPSIERPFGPHPIGVPSLIYTHGGPGVGCTEGDATEVIFVRLEKD